MKKGVVIQQPTSDRKLLLIFGAIAVAAILAAGFGIYYLGKRLNNNSPTVEQPNQKSVLDTTNVENIDLTIEESGIEPGSITLNAGRDYNFRIIKSPGMPCEALRNEDTNITIDVIRTATEFPLSIRAKGDYIFNCIGQDTSLRVRVK